MVLKNIIIGIAIIILTVAVAVYGINTFYPQPEYNDFCPDFRAAIVIDNQVQCETEGGLWNADNYPRKVLENGPDVYGYCDRDYTCRMEFEDANEKYARTVFLIALPVGIIIIAVGALVFGLEAVGAGLMGGGVGIILYGVGGFWRYADDWLKFVLSLVGLIAVIYLAYFFNRKWKKKQK